MNAWACSTAFCKKKSLSLALIRIIKCKDMGEISDHFWVSNTFSSLFHGASSMLTFARVTCLNAVRKWLQMSKAKPSMVLTCSQTQNVCLISNRLYNTHFWYQINTYTAWLNVCSNLKCHKKLHLLLLAWPGHGQCFWWCRLEWCPSCLQWGNLSESLA